MKPLSSTESPALPAQSELGEWHRDAGAQGCGAAQQPALCPLGSGPLWEASRPLPSAPCQLQWVTAGCKPSSHCHHKHVPTPTVALPHSLLTPPFPPEAVGVCLPGRRAWPPLVSGGEQEAGLWSLSCLAHGKHRRGGTEGGQGGRAPVVKLRTRHRGVLEYVRSLFVLGWKQFLTI